jgi:hypothetical protein
MLLGIEIIKAFCAEERDMYAACREAQIEEFIVARGAQTDDENLPWIHMVFRVSHAVCPNRCFIAGVGARNSNLYGTG